MTKKEWIHSTLHCQPTERVPIGFWHHYMPYWDMMSAIDDPTFFRMNLNGHTEYKKAYKPDFVKIMVDGLFFVPYDYANLKHAEDFKDLKVIDENDPWIQKNVEMVKYIRSLYGDDMMIFFNVFTPFTTIRDAVRFKQEGIPLSVDKMIDYLAEDKEIMKHAMDVVAHSIEVLLRKVIGEGMADGLYLCVSDPTGEIPFETYNECMRPSEEYVLKVANELSDTNLLHICGSLGSEQDKLMKLYSTYDVCAVNWATAITGITLAEGRKLFPGKALLGGFDNSGEGLLCKGTKEEIKAYTKKLVEEAGKVGLIIGADCTIPETTEPERFDWIREALEEL